MMHTATDARLSAAAAYVRQGACFADIGTDHAYLPVSLLRCGRISHAIATDVRQGPLDRAARTLRETGFSDAVTLYRTDGLDGLERLGLTDIAICGMGGELIAHILDRAPFVRDVSVRLILQPMTKADVLRTWLAGAGFSIPEETVAEAGGKLYCCLCATYTGIRTSLPPLEALLGPANLEKQEKSPAFLRMVQHLCRITARQIDGMRQGGQNTEQQQELLRQLKEVLVPDDLA